MNGIKIRLSALGSPNKTRHLRIIMRYRDRMKINSHSQTLLMFLNEAYRRDLLILSICREHH